MVVKGRVLGKRLVARKRKREKEGGREEEEEEGGVRENISRNREARTQNTGTDGVGGDAYLASMRCGAAPLSSRRLKSRRCGQPRRITTRWRRRWWLITETSLWMAVRTGRVRRRTRRSVVVDVERRTGRG